MVEAIQGARAADRAGPLRYFQQENDDGQCTADDSSAERDFKAGKVALGLLTRLARSGDIARIAKTTGHDFVFIDAQHAAYNIETIGHIAQAALGIGIAPLVRVRSCDDPQTQVFLDIGATGIVFPDVNTAAEAKRAVDRARFPPRRQALGRRARIRFSTTAPSRCRTRSRRSRRTRSSCA